MDILYLSHCTPYPPDKGERIRTYHEVIRLAKRHRVHVRCFAKQKAELRDVQSLAVHCASLEAVLMGSLALPLALVRFAGGACLSTAYYTSSKLKHSVEELTRSVRLGATVAYSAVMAPYAPADVPLIFDQVDVDSKKWLQYAEQRWPSALYQMEARRLQRIETEYGNRSRCVFLTTEQETRLYQAFAPGARTVTMENGVDFEYFAPARSSCPFGAGPAVVFVGAMDYFPNIDAACEFATNRLPDLRRRIAGLEFWIVGRSPAAQVRKLASLPGVRISGTVADVRPYVQNALASVAPLRIARGIQNKVLESLAMDKPALVSPATARTFGEALPYGVVPCESTVDYARALDCLSQWQPGEIRARAQARFLWSTALGPLDVEIEALAGTPA